MSSMLVVFRARYGAARLLELQSITEQCYPAQTGSWEWDETCHLFNGGDFGPNLIQRLPDGLSPTQWAAIGSRCVSCRGIFQILGEGSTLAACVESTRSISEEMLLSLIDDSWAIHIHMLGKSDRLHPSERTQRIESFRESLGALSQRRVDLEHPTHDLWLLEDYQHLLNTEAPQRPHRVYLLLRVTAASSLAHSWCQRADIKKRPFIHTTTLDAERSLLMTNLAKITPHSTLLDPFCGSGSLLIAAMQLGAASVGADCAAQLLSSERKAIPFPSSVDRPHRGTEKVSIYDSFDELDLPAPTLIPGADIRDPTVAIQYLRANANQLFDAIVTDPPYGIRESQSALSETEISERLCTIGTEVLRDGGRLVFLRLIEGRIDDITDALPSVHRDLKVLCQTTPFALVLTSLERFNAKCLRVTIVLERHSTARAGRRPTS